MALWPIFRVARFSRTNLGMLVARALKISQLIPRARDVTPPNYDSMHQDQHEPCFPSDSLSCHSFSSRMR
jgi:hypothetical protein